jgi:uncharacterized protein YdhG (YjbR/CyaY superfamily)
MKRVDARNRRSARKSRNSATKSKRKTVPKTVDEYLARVPEPARSALNQIRVAIRSEVPAEATEVISYSIPAFKYKRILVWFAAFSDHCSLFPTASVIETFKDELKAYSTSKGTVHFPLDKALPTAFIRKLVKARVAQAEGKKDKTG